MGTGVLEEYRSRRGVHGNMRDTAEQECMKGMGNVLECRSSRAVHVCISSIGG
jgi:hypothetical protein